VDVLAGCVQVAEDERLGMCRVYASWNCPVCGGVHWLIEGGVKFKQHPGCEKPSSIGVRSIGPIETKCGSVKVWLFPKEDEGPQRDGRSIYGQALPCEVAGFGEPHYQFFYWRHVPKTEVLAFSKSFSRRNI
jgi:hypothetical protein